MTTHPQNTDQDTGTYIITLPPPTPNGGLHVGHMAGPFLAADVYAKALMLGGHTPHVTSFSDTNQSYVRATAARQGKEPLALARHWSDNIVETLGLYHCTLDHYFEPTTDSCDDIRAFFLGLYERGILKRKTKRFFYSTVAKAFLDEAGVGGFCPQCLEACTCGICEGCGMLTCADDLISPRNAMVPEDDLERREVEVLVLELETLRDRIDEFHTDNPLVRPKYAWLAQDALKQPLPDYPITVPGDWGISLGHPDFDGQVVNAWPEIMANFLYAYEKHLAGSDTPVNVVNFFGYDNSCFYAIVHVGLLIASGNDRFLPLCTMTNEFYNLEHAKFSTSRNHAIWSFDLASDYPADFTRFFLALTAPGFEQGNFNFQEMGAVINRRLVAPWNALAGRINAAPAGPRPAPSARARDAAAILSRRLRASLALDRFNLRQAAEDVLNPFELCAAWLDASAGADAGADMAPTPQDAADTLHLLRQWSTEIWVFMPRLAPALARQIDDAIAGTGGALVNDLAGLCRQLNNLPTETAVPTAAE